MFARGCPWVRAASPQSLAGGMPSVARTAVTQALAKEILKDINQPWEALNGS